MLFVLLENLAPATTSIGEAIAAARAAAVPLDDLHAQLMTQGFAFDYRVPEVRPYVPSSTTGDTHPQLDAAQLSPQSAYDLAKAAEIQPGIWRAPPGGGEAGKPWPDRYFLLGHATNRTGHHAVLSIIFTVKDAELPASAELSCENQRISAAQPTTVACQLGWPRARQAAPTTPDEAATVRALSAVQSGLATLEAERMILSISDRTLARGYVAGIEGDSEHRLRQQARLAARALVSEQSCRALGQCGERLIGVLNQPTSLLLPAGLLVMGWTARRRLRGAPPARGMRIFMRGVFGLYAAFVAIALLAFPLDAAAGGMYKGLISAFATMLVASPWSSLLIGNAGFASLSESATLGLLWLFVAINFTWLGVMAFAHGRQPSA